MYQAIIEFTVYKDDYENGQSEELVNSWGETLTNTDPERLKDLILEITHTKDWSDVDNDQINDYDWATEYHTSYLAINDNELGIVTPSDHEIDEWKLGRETLYSVNCHILVSKLITEKAVL